MEQVGGIPLGRNGPGPPPTPLLLLSSSALSRNIWGSVPSDPVKTHPGTLGLTPGQSHARIWKVWVAVGISLP